MSDIVIVYVIFAVFGIILVIFADKKKQIHDEKLERQALKRGGQFKKAKLLPSKLLIPVNGRIFSFSIITVRGGKNSPRQTHLECNLGGLRKFTLSILRESFLTKFAKKFGMKDIHIGSPEFDEAFVLNSNDEMTARNLLNHEVQAALLQIKEENPTISSLYGKFSLMFPKWVNTDEELDLFIDTALAVMGRLTQLY